jgi:chloramphenicol-sensitive protein RarD
VGAVACIVLTVDYGRPPWIALVLAFSFGTYGLAKKQAGAEAVESLTLETMLLAPLALGYLAWLAMQGSSTFGTEGIGHALLLMSAGLVTAVPLLCFGAAAIRVPMVTLGLLQYLAPVLQFGLGVVYFHEEMSGGRWIGFALVWVALAIFTVESVRHRQRQLRLTAEAIAV